MSLKTTAIWGCTGLNTAELSFRLAQAEAEKGKTLVVELPCLGIPRLGFAADVLDRVHSVESVILKTEQKLPLEWQMIHQYNENLGVLPASVFAAPDCPIVSKVNLNTLIEFAETLKKFAEKEKCRHLILDCQGQLTSPMTFFALKTAEKVVIPISIPTDAAYVLANVRRLIGTYRHPADKFILLTEGDAKAIRRIAVIKSENGKTINGMKIIAWNQDFLEQLERRLEEQLEEPLDQQLEENMNREMAEEMLLQEECLEETQQQLWPSAKGEIFPNWERPECVLGKSTAVSQFQL